METNLPKYSSLTLTQLFPLLFPFLDPSTIHICKLVNKDWSQQITKCYQSRELRLFSEFYSLAEEINKEELTSYEVSKINRLLVDTSKAMVFLQKSFIYHPQAMEILNGLVNYVYPPFQLFNLFYSFVALTDPPNFPWEKIVLGNYTCSSFRQLYYFGVRDDLDFLQENLNKPWFFLEISEVAIQRAEELLSKKPLTPGGLSDFLTDSHYLSFWIILILGSAKLRLQLTEKARNIFDCIHLNTPFEKREELVKLNREQEICSIWSIREKYSKKIADYEKRLEELSVRRERNNIELTALKHTVQDLKIEMQKIQHRFKKQPPQRK